MITCPARWASQHPEVGAQLCPHLHSEGRMMSGEQVTHPRPHLTKEDGLG